MKKWIFLTILSVVTLLYFLYISREIGVNANLKQAENKGSDIEHPKIAKATLVQSESEYPNKINLGAKNCDDLTALCPKCDLHMQELIDEVESIGFEAASNGPYALMTTENLLALANTGDKNALYYHGVNLGWEGVLGIGYLDLSNTREFTPNTRREKMKSHKLDMTKINLGEEFLYLAALHDRATGWLEIQNIMSMVFQRLQSKPIDDEELYRETLAKYMAVADVAQEIYKNDKQYFDIYLMGLNGNGMALVEKWKEGAPKDEVQKEINLISKLADDYYKKYLKRWTRDRKFNGKDVYPIIYDPNFGKYYKAYQELCWDKYN